MNRIVLFEPEKPANTGNIIRTCMAFDAKLTIIGPLSFSLDDKAFMRAKMDYALNFEIERMDTIDEFLERYKKWEGYFVTRYSKHVYSTNDYSDDTKDYFFMFGRESTGIPYDVLRKHLDRTIRIPMAINARSLNLSDSVSIIISEVKRQQKFSSLAVSETIKGKDFLG